MKEIFLIRHGETDWNAAGRLQGREDVPLNSKGEAQAHRLAEALHGLGIERIVTSYLSRARRTAEIVAGKLAISDLGVVEGLHERDYGDISGLTPEERAARFPPGTVPANQETAAAMKERVMAALHDIATLHAERKIAVVSHGGVINTLLANITDGQHGTGKNLLPNCSITKFRRHGDTWSVQYFGVSADVLATHEPPV
ncbi:MAG: histidine phosphatase family protein [Steroidobacteraceae bacterium]